VLIVDLSGLAATAVDPDTDSVRVGGGATWGDVDRATAEHRRAAPSGIIAAIASAQRGYR